MFARMRIHKAQLKEMIRIGIPAGFQASLFSISNVMAQSSINSFGDVVMSGHSSGQNIDNMVWMVTNSFHQTAVNFVGQNTGAKQYKRVGQIMWRTCLVMVLAEFVCGALVIAFAPQLLSFYITDSAQAIEYGVLRMTIFCCTYWLCGLMDVMVGGIRGMGISVPPMVVSILGICGLRVLWVTTIFQIPEYHTLTSLYVSYPISWAITFLLQVAIFVPAYRSRRRQFPEETVSN
jgi:Na+-driven multidrug efflux pump